MKLACLKFFLILSFVIGYLSFTLSTASAAGPPDPKPCKNPQDTELVDNYLIGDDGRPPILPLTGFDKVTGDDPSEKPEDHRGQVFNLTPPKTFTFQVNFSKLQAIFGPTNSNYLEGKFQDNSHNTSNLLDLSSANLNQFNGASGKTQPKILTDELRKKYVEYIYNHPQLPESANKYTDIEGKGNPVTIYDLVTQFGQPDPPQSDASDSQKQAWEDAWGKYWPKIPTAWSEFYKAEIRFHYVSGDRGLALAQTESLCPSRFEDPYVKFVMPEFYRTTATSDQLNRQIVPKAAQSFQAHGILPNTIAAVNSVKDAFAYCWKLLTNPSQISKSINKVISGLAAPAYAAEPTPTPLPCLRVFKDSKNGQAPYCPLPQEEVARLGNAVSCSNQNDAFKLEKDNPNVICNFTFTVTPRYQIDKFNATDCKGLGGNMYECDPKVYIIPNFRIPWLAAIWNNTLSSEKSQTLSNQEANRPGIYSFFTPQSIYQELFPSAYSQALDLLTRCYPNWPNQTPGDANACNQLDSIGNIIPCAIDPDITKVAQCLSGKINKNLPGKVNSQGSKINQKYIGGTDCNKGFVRDLALKPKALQQNLNVKSDCLANTVSFNPNSNGTGPGNIQPNGSNCNGLYALDNPIHQNFGDPNCDFTMEKLSQQLNSLDSANLSTWLSMVGIESGGNPNAYNGNSTSGSAWGLLQMGHEAYPDFGISKQMNNQYDRGDVVWSLQAYNAISYNSIDNNHFCYWDAAFTLGVAIPANCPE